MKKLRFSSYILILGLLALPSPSVAIVGSARTWVSSTGLDTNACSRTSPCLTFAGALAKTLAGGEINCVDSADFGPVTIDRALTIDCGGAFGSIIAPDHGNGIGVGAGSSDVVTIRNLSIRGAIGASGNTGVNYGTAKAVHLENVTVRGMGGYCIEVGPLHAALLTIDNTTIADCVLDGVTLATTSTTSGDTVVANINNTRIFNTRAGVNADNGSRVTIRDSTIYFNNLGVLQSSFSGTALGSTVTVVNSTLGYSNIAALESVSGDFILAFGNTFVNDVLALSPSGGMIFTGGDNINSGSSQGTANGGSVQKF